MPKQIKVHKPNQKNSFKSLRLNSLYRWCKKPKSIVGITILVASCSGLVACGRDFTNVKELGERGTVIKASSSVLADNFYQSCLRQATIPKQNLETANYFTERKSDLENCREKYQPAKNSIVDAYAVLATYLEKLAAVASEETGKISDEEVEKLNQGLGNLVTELEGISDDPIPPVVTENLDQAGGLVRKLFNIFASGIREDAIVPTLACTNDDIDGYTQGLEAIANQVFVNTLNSERQRIDSYYTNLLPQQPDDMATYHPLSYPSERLSARELVWSYNADLEQIDKQQALAIEFADFLKKTRETHTKISMMFRQELGLNSDGDYKSYCQKFEESIAQKSTAYQRLEMTPELSAKMVKILEEYYQETEPMLKTLQAANF